MSSQSFDSLDEAKRHLRPIWKRSEEGVTFTIYDNHEARTEMDEVK